MASLYKQLGYWATKKSKRLKSIKVQYIDNKVTMPHIGNLLVQVMEEKRLTKTDVARLIGCNPVSMHSYIKAQTLQLKLIWKLCEGLGYNFFEHISNQIGDNAQIKLEQRNLIATQQQQIQEMQQQIRDLQKEVAIYKDLLKR